MSEWPHFPRGDLNSEILTFCVRFSGIPQRADSKMAKMVEREILTKLQLIGTLIRGSHSSVSYSKMSKGRTIERGILCLWTTSVTVEEWK